MRALTALALCLFLTGCGGGGGGDDTEVIGNQGPRTDHRAVAIADFNGDGLNDLIGASSFVTFGPAPNPDEIRVYLQRFERPGDFSAPVVYRVGSNLGIERLSVADLQLDQLPDVVAWSISDNKLRVMLQTTWAPGELQPAIPYSIPGANPGSGRHAIADLDLDGLPDIAVVGERQVAFRLQDAGNPGYFLDQRVVGNGTQDVTIADINNDGLADIAAFGVEPRSDLAEDLLLYLQDPMVPVTFPSPITLQMGDETGRDLVSEDVNRDGKFDLVASGNFADSFTDTDSHINVFLQGDNGDFSRVAYRSPDLGYVWGDLKVSMLNADNRPDVVVSGLDLYLFFQLESGALSHEISIVAPRDQAVRAGGVNTLDVGDLNRDGLQDIAFTNGELFVAFQLDSGEGFSAPVRIAGQL